MSGSRAQLLRRNLRLIYVDAVVFSVMVGAGETYLAAFVLALGMGEVTAGLIASIPMLAGAVIQLISPAMVRRMRSNRRWVVACALVQAAAFIPLVVSALLGQSVEFVIFLIAALYWGSGMATGPAWNTWIGTIVPRPIRAHYFARRSRSAHVAVLCGIVLGGIGLQVGASLGHALLAFAILFSIAGAARFISAAILSRQTEPVKPDDQHRMVPARELLGRFRTAHDGRLLLYMLAVQTAVQISGPYFTPYMLKNMELSYALYLLLIATSYTARIVALPTLGGFVRRIGAQRVMWYAGVCMVPLSALWLVSQSVIYLFFVQLIAGFVWAAYELATLLLMFETIPERERTSVLTTFNLANAVATVLGSTMGAIFLHAIGTNYTAYMTVFGISSIARIFTLPLLGPAVRSISAAALPLQPIPVPTRVISVRPEFSDSERPILPGIPPAPSDVPSTRRSDMLEIPPAVSE